MPPENSQPARKPQGPFHRWLLPGLLAAGLAWLGSLLIYLATRGPLPEQVVVIAHRGGAALAPENTLAAFQQARRLGVEMLETDVRQTRDGVLVLMHDASVNRTTRGNGPVEAMTAAEAEALGVCSFEQYLGLGGKLLPEAKGSTPGLEAAMVAAIRGHGLLGQVVVQSFSVASLQRLHQQAPQLKLCRLYYPWRLWLGSNPPGVKVLSPNAEALLLNPWMVRQAQRQGYQVWPWFGLAESALTVAWMRALGVDGLMLDDPRALLQKGSTLPGRE